MRYSPAKVMTTATVSADMQRTPEALPAAEPATTPATAVPVRRIAVIKPLFATAVIVLLIAGWRLRDAEYTVADQGLGYALGIVGGVMMLTLLLYPLRKKARFMRNWGALRHWFRLHMLLGILGPVAILFHCNFHLGATNSNVALFCMLVVSGSGLIGRYAYTRIHFGLYGRRATLEELAKNSGLIAGDMQGALAELPDVVRDLQDFQARATRPYSGLLRGLIAALLLGFAAARTRRRTLRALNVALRQRARTEAWDRRILRARQAHLRGLIESYIASVRQVAEFTAYERLFAFWHVLHIPLFFMLLLAGIVHVFAVHVY